MDALAQDISNLTLFLKEKKGYSGDGPYSVPRRSNRDHQCSYCNDSGHSALKCEKNQHRNTLCSNSGKIGRSEATRWSTGGRKLLDRGKAV